MARLLPIRLSRPNLGTKSPKASPPRRSLPWIRAALPLVRRSRRSRLRPVTPPVPKKEEIVYLNLSDLHPFKNHPFGVRDDAEMQGLVESVKAAGVNQPALVRPREDGGYEIIAGHRRQRASELAGFANMPCIVRNMTDDEAILAMTDDNLRHRERILPTEKAQSLKMQVEAIKHQGSRPERRTRTPENAPRRSWEIATA